MTRNEIQYVRGTIENEGFDYAFRYYTDFKKTVTDRQFHKLREAYIKAAENLTEYLEAEYVEAEAE